MILQWCAVLPSLFDIFGIHRCWLTDSLGRSHGKWARQELVDPWIFWVQSWERVGPSLCSSHSQVLGLMIETRLCKRISSWSFDDLFFVNWVKEIDSSILAVKHSGCWIVISTPQTEPSFIKISGPVTFWRPCSRQVPRLTPETTRLSGSDLLKQAL